MENITANFPDISFIDNATVEEVLTQMINDYQEKYKELTKKEVSLAQSDPYRLIMYACTIQIYQAWTTLRHLEAYAETKPHRQQLCFNFLLRLRLHPLCLFRQGAG